MRLVKAGGIALRRSRASALDRRCGLWAGIKFLENSRGVYHQEEHRNHPESTSGLWKTPPAESDLQVLPKPLEAVESRELGFILPCVRGLTCERHPDDGAPLPATEQTERVDS